MNILLFHTNQKTLAKLIFMVMITPCGGPIEQTSIEELEGRDLIRFNRKAQIRVMSKVWSTNCGKLSV